MVDVVEESFDVKINDMIQVLYLHQPHTLCNRCFSRAIRAEPV